MFILRKLETARAERFEDGLEDVAGVLTVDQPHVQRQPGGVRERFEKARRQVAPEPACPGVAQVDVAGDERPSGGLERHLRERLVGRHERRAVPERAVRPEQRGKRLAERATRIGDLRLGVVRRQLERELERPLRASSVSRWSSTGMPVATLAGPVPTATLALMRPERSRSLGVSFCRTFDHALTGSIAMILCGEMRFLQAISGAIAAAFLVAGPALPAIDQGARRPGRREVRSSPTRRACARTRPGAPPCSDHPAAPRSQGHRGAAS